MMDASTCLEARHGAIGTRGMLDSYGQERSGRRTCSGHDRACAFDEAASVASRADTRAPGHHSLPLVQSAPRADVAGPVPKSRARSSTRRCGPGPSWRTRPDVECARMTHTGCTRALSEGSTSCWWRALRPGALRQRASTPSQGWSMSPTETARDRWFVRSLVWSGPGRRYGCRGGRRDP